MNLVRAMRDAGPRWRAAGIVAACALGGFALVAALVVVTGGSVGDAVGGWWRGAWGTPYNVAQTVTAALPLVLIGLGAVVALRAGVIAVGAEGQVILGAILATAVVSALPGWPAAVLLPLAAVAGAAGGMLWSLMPALARARWQVNELLSALLANYVAIGILGYLLRTVLADPARPATPQSAALPEASLLAHLPVPGRLHAGVFLVLAALLAMVWWQRSRSAFLLDVHAQRPWLAARAGLGSARAVISTLVFSGATAGLAGWMQLAGVAERLHPSISAGVGFTGLVVAVLGRGSAWGILAAALAFASLSTGSTGIQLATGTTPAAVGTITQAILLLAAALAVVTARRQLTTAKAEAADV